jgi:MarR family transcriptional regulator, 2-MHQ and catechol-resistance regulon repressor
MKTIDQEINASKFTSSGHKAMINLFYTYFNLFEIQQSYFKNFGILPQHYNIMRILNGKFPNPVTPGHIIDSMLDKKRDFTRLIDKLEEMELVNRTRNIDNRRMILISLTPKGLELYHRINKGLDAVIAHGLNEEESEALSHLLDKMRCK